MNFQSWLDPFIIITALPAALAGIIVFLFLTNTTLSVPAMMGAIRIVVVSFAKEGSPSTATPGRPPSRRE